MFVQILKAQYKEAATVNALMNESPVRNFTYWARNVPFFTKFKIKYKEKSLNLR